MTDKRPMKTEDLLNIKWAGDPQISPDGKKIIYVETTIDAETKTYQSNLWQVSSCGCCKPEPFTNGKNDSFPRWSPCGGSVAFVGKRNDDSQIWVLKNGGGEARQLTHMRYGASNPAWSPDGSKIAFAANHSEHADLENWKNDIFVVAADGGEPTALTHSDGSYGNPVWTCLLYTSD